MDLIEAYYKQKAKGIKSFPCHTNRASSLGGACERQLTYDRTSWSQATLPDVDLQIIFDEGSIHEGEVLRTLQEAGVQVIEQQRTLDWPQYQITGHVDAVIVDGTNAPPIDVKSMSGHIWDSIFRRGKGIYEWTEVAEGFTTKPWLRKYLAQVTLYCLMKNTERGALICKNKNTGGLAQVNIPLDYAYGEFLLKRAERINEHVAKGTMPDRIPWDEDICSKCPYLHLCLPDRVGKDPLVFLEDSTVENLLTARSELEADAKGFKRLDDRAKEWAKARPESKMSIGKWLVTKSGSSSRTVVKFERVA